MSIAVTVFLQESTYTTALAGLSAKYGPLNKKSAQVSLLEAPKYCINYVIVPCAVVNDGNHDGIFLDIPSTSSELTLKPATYIKPITSHSNPH